MKALSIRQPWAWAILHAGKQVENRSWPTAYRGPILIHASKTYDRDGHEWIKSELGIQIPETACGGIVGQARLVSCVTEADSRWFFGPFGFVLEDVEPLPFVKCRGRLGIFHIPDRIVAP